MYFISILLCVLYNYKITNSGLSGLNILLIYKSYSNSSLVQI